jgi:hypothetical protein
MTPYTAEITGDVLTVTGDTAPDAPALGLAPVVDPGPGQ